MPKNNDAKQSRAYPYKDVKEKLLQYVELQAQHYKHDKCGLSWAVLKQKALFYTEQLEHDVNNFKTGDYFILSVLKKSNKKYVALHGEGMEMSKEDKVSHRASFICSLREHMECYDVPVNCIYNADQTGLFYNKLPNQIYINKEERDYCSLKQMKSKD